MEMLWLIFGIHNPSLFCPDLVGVQLVLVQGWRSGGRGKPGKYKSQTSLMTVKGLLPTLQILVRVYIQFLPKFNYYNTHFIDAEVT